MSSMKPLSVIFEKDDGDEIAGSVHVPEHFLFTTVGTTEHEVVENLRAQVADYIANEGAQSPDWQGVDATQIVFESEYDLTAFFTVFSAIKINSIAKLAGINEGLMRQYASGVKTAGAAQVARVEAATHALGERLMKVSLVSA